MSDETQNEQVEGAQPAVAPAKKKSGKDPLTSASVLIGALGLAAAAAAIIASVMG